MNESEWLKSADPNRMIVQHGRSFRKLRLFACACCRQVWNQFVTPFTIRVVTAAEAFADNEIKEADLAQVHEIAREAAEVDRQGINSGASNYLAHVAYAAACVCFHAPLTVAELAIQRCARAAGDLPPTSESREMNSEFAAELAVQADLLRDIFGNPFREVAFDPAWRTSDVLAMANAMYANRDFSAMPILADALQDAGCDNEDILEHCREEREHVRGCWVVDMVLGK